MLELIGVSKRFESAEDATAADIVAVDDVSLNVAEGEFVVLVGESGCGKTTTLKMINRLIEPSAGMITVDGQPVRSQRTVQLRRNIGYVFQEVGLLPHYTIGENIAIVPRLLRWKSNDVTDRVGELLSLVGLPDDVTDRFPHALSGGQQQRVGVARALAARQKIVLLDEPFGALDPITRSSLQTEYAKIHTSLGLTTVMVTHDMAEALLLADRIVVMRHGKIEHVGTPQQLVHATGDTYVAELVGTPLRQAERLDALARYGATA